MAKLRLGLVLAAGALLLGSYLFLKPSPPVTEPRDRALALVPVEAPATQRLPARPASARHPLQSYLLAEASPERDSVLLSMIRDAGFACAEIVSTTDLPAETAAWRVACPATRAYLLEVDGTGSIRVDALLYDDGLGPSIRPTIDLEPSTNP